MCCRMLSFGVFVAVAAAVAASSGVACADESPSGLLEKAIYTEETVGDLDAAVKLYEKAVAEAKKTEAVAAKAQYRLGLCLLKQGKKEQGIAALEEVRRRFPAQKELVAAAQKHLPATPGLKLNPPMWGDGESLHYRIELAGGLEIGAIFYSVERAALDGKKIWRFRSRTSAAGQQLASRVDADLETLLPINSSWTIGSASDTKCQYERGKVVVKTIAAGAEKTRTIEIAPAPYDNEEGVFVFRCLPMVEKYKATVPIFASIGAGGIDIGLEVRGQETIEVPAGKFKCFKVFLTPVNQTFWMSDDEHRYLVKMEANNVIIPLEKIERLVAGETKKYADDDISFSLPSDSYVYGKGAGPSDNKPNEPGLTLLAPEVDWEIKIATTKLEKLSAELKTSPRASAERGLLDMAKQLKELKVRADSWQSTPISGQPAASYVADFTGANGRPMALYVTCVFGKTIAASITVNCPRDDLDRVKKLVRPILDSLEVK
jgi:hypothetical protein